MGSNNLYLSQTILNCVNRPICAPKTMSTTFVHLYRGCSPCIYSFAFDVVLLWFKNHNNIAIYDNLTMTIFKLSLSFLKQRDQTMGKKIVCILCWRTKIVCILRWGTKCRLQSDTKHQEIMTHSCLNDDGGNYRGMFKHWNVSNSHKSRGKTKM